MNKEQSNENAGTETSENVDINISENTDISISEKAAQLMEINDRTEEQERELEEELFGKSNMKYADQFKHHSFLSLGQTRSACAESKEWMGETVNDEIVVVQYKNGNLLIGTGRNEIKARNNILLVGGTKDKSGEVGVYSGLTLRKINEDLKLEWTFPVGFVED